MAFIGTGVVKGVTGEEMLSEESVVSGAVISVDKAVGVGVEAMAGVGEAIVAIGVTVCFSGIPREIATGGVSEETLEGVLELRAMAGRVGGAFTGIALGMLMACEGFLTIVEEG